MSNSRKLDKFYTKHDIVKELFDEEGKWYEEVSEIIDFRKYDVILDPSAGTSNFSEFLTRFGNVIAIDISPQDNQHILQKYFLSEKLELDSKTITVGNPPSETAI